MTASQQPKGDRRDPIKWLVLIFCLATLITWPSVTHEAQAQEVDELAQLYGTYDMYSKAPIGVIVELETPSLVEAEHLGISQTKGYIDYQRRKVMKRIEKEIPKVTFDDITYDTLLAGMAISLPVTELPRLAAIEGIRAIYPDLLYAVEKHNGPIIYDPEQADVHSPGLTGLHTVRKKWNYTGDGVTVAVVDSGVDYRHPALEHAFGPYKGWDFIDHDDAPLETAADNPAGEPTSHGTRMAGLIAAKGTLEGIAPDANLLAYRVIGPGGTGHTRHVLAGLERAVQDGADIINLSLINQETDWALGKAIHWAQSKDHVVVVHPKLHTAVDPEQIETENLLSPLQADAVPGTAQPFTAELVLEDSVYIANLRPAKNPHSSSSRSEKRHELIYVGQYSLAEIQRLDLQDKLVLLRDDQLPLRDYLVALHQGGAAGAIIYLSEVGEPGLTVAGLPLPTYALGASEAEALLQMRKSRWQSGPKEIKLIKISTGPKPGELLPASGTEAVQPSTPDLLTSGAAALTTLPLSTTEDRTDYAYTASHGAQNAVALTSGASALLIQAEKESATPLSTAERIVLFTSTAYQVQQLGLKDIGDALALRQPEAGRLNIYSAITQLLSDEEEKEPKAQPKRDLPTSRKRSKPDKERTENQVQNGKHTDSISSAFSTATLNVLPLDSGLYQIQLTLPEKADLVQLWLFDQDHNYVGALDTYLGVDQVHVPRWTGHLDYHPLPEGRYTLVAYATKNGKGTFINSDPFVYMRK